MVWEKREQIQYLTNENGVTCYHREANILVFGLLVYKREFIDYAYCNRNNGTVIKGFKKDENKTKRNNLKNKK